MIVAIMLALLLFAEQSHAASGRQPPPPGSFKGAPSQLTRFSTAELSRGFLALAFGSDLRIGAAPVGIRRFDRPISLQIIPGGSVDRAAAMRGIVEEYARRVPGLQLRLAAPGDTADIEVRLIDEKDFRSALQAAFGASVAKAFIARTDPQCMTSVKSSVEGVILNSVTFIIVDEGDAVFLDCAYHELLHAFGLSNHDQDNPWTTLNQKRMVGYLSVYDAALLTLLYDPRIAPGMTRTKARTVLPSVIEDLKLAVPAAGR